MPKFKCHVWGERSKYRDLANFGHDVRFATVLPDNPLGIAAYRSLRQYGIDLTPTKLKGDILGSYYVEVGYSLRASNVIYNRKYSAIAQMEANTLDIDEVLSDRTHLHVSGITLALGKEIREFTLELVKVAFERGLVLILIIVQNYGLLKKRLR